MNSTVNVVFTGESTRTKETDPLQMTCLRSVTLLSCIIRLTIPGHQLVKRPTPVKKPEQVSERLEVHDIE